MYTWDNIRLEEKENRLWELYHENSKIPCYALKDIHAEVPKMIESDFHLSLPVQSHWTRPLEYRHTSDFIDIYRKKENPSLTFPVLSEIMHFGLANTTRGYRGHGISPLEVFWLIRDMDGFPSGVCHVNQAQRTVALVDGRPDPELLRHLPQERACILITGFLPRIGHIYGERGYRIALTESGRLAQACMIASEALGLRAYLEEAFYERAIERLLGIDGVEHIILQVLALSAVK